MREEHLERTVERGPLAARLQENLHGILAGAAAVFLALVVAGVLFAPPQDSLDARSRLQAAAEDLAAHLHGVRFDHAAYAERVAGLAAGVQGRLAPLDIESAPDLDVSPWPAKLLADLRDGRGNEVRFSAPDKMSVDPDRGFNQIRWSIDPGSNVRISAFAIERAEGSMPFREIGRVPGEVFAFEDRLIRPGVAYAYRVAAETDEAFLPSGQRRSPASEPVSVVAIADFRLTLLRGRSDDGVAEVQVDKWHEGRWWTRVYEVRQGEAIGAPDPGTGVDYSTGRQVDELRFEEAVRVEPLLQVVFDGAGRVRVEGGAPVTELMDVERRWIKVVLRVSGGTMPPEILEAEQKS